MLQAIYDKLVPGGSFVWFDRVYPKQGDGALLNQQLKRYRYLSPGACKAISAHDLQDFTDTYRMDERPLLQLMRRLGFTGLRVVERIEREVVLVAQRPDSRSGARLL